MKQQMSDECVKLLNEIEELKQEKILTKVYNKAIINFIEKERDRYRNALEEIFFGEFEYKKVDEICRKALDGDE
jgi:predicted ribosome quality control (RQC) complex YloA/Tae2 family protein